mgnify:CR=1 FL=1
MIGRFAGWRCYAIHSPTVLVAAIGAPAEAHYGYLLSTVSYPDRIARRPAVSIRLGEPFAPDWGHQAMAFEEAGLLDRPTG